MSQVSGRHAHPCCIYSCFLANSLHIYRYIRIREQGNLQVFVWLKVSPRIERLFVVSVAPLGHSAAVTCLASHSDNILLLSGSEDSTAKLLNSNTGKVCLHIDQN